MVETASQFALEDHVATELGWTSIQEALAQRTQTERGCVDAKQWRACASPQDVRLALRRVEEARGLSREDLPLPLGAVDDVAPLAKRAEKGGVLTAQELLACAWVLQTGREVRRFLQSVASQAPELSEVAYSLPPQSELAARIEAVIETSGRLRDDASEELAEGREQLRRLHRGIKARVDVYLQDPDFEVCLQDNFFSVRGERYVFPIRASQRHRVPGIVHNTSQSGETVFVEPEDLMEQGNELTLCRSRVEDEERRILAEFSNDIGASSALVEHVVARLAHLDRIWAASRLADELDAVVPDIIEEAQGFSLIEARHPLLVLGGKAVVPNDIRMAAGHCALVISGPNAGGKTVSMTTVGLCAVMMWAGLPIPVSRGSRLPLFSGVLSAIGDHQDLTRDLSTFSAHLASLAAMVAQVAPGWLVLIDEIASGTDPAEGSALARAVLDELMEGGALTLVTTHLEGIKALGIVDERVLNARVCFDNQSMAPNFELEFDAAGVSNAIDIAQRMGLPLSIVDRARSYLDSQGALTVALNRLAAEHEHVRVEREKLERLGRQARVEVEERARQRACMEEQRFDLEMKIRGEMADELAHIGQEARQLLAQMRAKPHIRQAEAVRAKIDGLRHVQRAGLESLAAANEKKRVGADSLSRVKIGDRVHVRSLGRDGEVVGLEEDGLRVSLGSMRMRVSLQDVMKSAARSEKQAQKKSRGPVVVHRRGGESFVAEKCDLRGLRLEEARRELVRFLDANLCEGRTQVAVLHGVGTGVIRTMVHDTLSTASYVETFRAARDFEGGDGVTLVSLAT